MRLPAPLALLKETYQAWSADNASRLGAALAYYSIFSIGPLLLIAIAIAGAFLGTAQARAQVYAQIVGTLGTQGAQAVTTMLDNAFRPGAGLIATIAGVVGLVAAASGIFGQVQAALDAIWHVRPAQNRPWWGMVLDQVVAVVAVAAAGTLLLASLVARTLLSALGGEVSRWLPGGGWVWGWAQMGLSFAVVTVLFMGVYKWLPHVRLAWRDVFGGAALTAALFLVGVWAIGWYLGHSAVGSVYGAAGSLVVVMVWVYYTAQVVFFGAELTKAWVERRGRGYQPAPGARFVVEIEQAEPPARAGRSTRPSLPPSYPGSR